MKKSKNSKQQILTAALREFATHGYDGARMEKIAQRAKINKAMLFYYYSSKQILYQNVIKKAFSTLMPRIARVFTPILSPQKFLEMVPRIHIQFMRNNRDLIKLISFDMLNNHKHIGPVIKETLENLPIPGPETIGNLVKKWHKKGLISENDPLHFMSNILSLTIFTLIAQPLLMRVFGDESMNDEQYFQQRTTSIINLLKRGMLK